MSGRRARPVAAAGALLLAGAALSACTEVESAEVEGYQPAKVTDVDGPGERRLVTFTAEGARRVAVETAPVGRLGERRVVPADAVLYDADGTAFVYTVRAPRSYLRTDVEVDRVAGDRLVLSRGPAPGSAVVTTGAPEVHGAELDIAGSH